MEFWVKLINVIDTSCQSARDDLYCNATHIGGDYWLYEGDEDCLHEGIDFEVVGEEAVPGMGDLSSRDLRVMVWNYYGVDLRKDGDE